MAAVVNRFIRGLNNQLLHSHHHGHYLHNARGDVTQRIDLQRDHQGNVITDQQGNAVIVILHNYFYDGFGNEVSYYKGYNPINDEEATNTNPWRYAGEYFDFETGNYYLRARYFNTATGRFTQPDPFWDTTNMIFGAVPITVSGRTAPNRHAILQSGNLFAFGMNNPVRFVDPTGLWGKDVHETMTIEWAMALGIPRELATIIGVANYGVDDGWRTFEGGNSPVPWGDPSRHFDRSTRNSQDTRLIHANYHLYRALTLATQALDFYESRTNQMRFFLDAGIIRRAEYERSLVNITNTFNILMEASLVHIGMGLHSLQDIEAHGRAGATSWGLSMHMPSGFHHLLGGGLDNINYVWANANQRRVIPGNGLQTRLDATRTQTDLFIIRFLDGIGGLSNLRR